MSHPQAAVRIGVFGHVGNRNLGDEALVSVVLDNVRRRFPSAEIRGFTLKPDDTTERHGIPAFPIRRLDKRPASPAPPERDPGDAQPTRTSSGTLGRLKDRLKTYPAVFGTLKKIQAVLLVLLEVLQEPGFLIRCYRNLEGVDLFIVAGSSQLIDYVAGGAWGHPFTVFKWVLLAKLRGSKVAFMSCGVGPVETRLGRFFIRRSLKVADYRSYRDEVSMNCAEQIGAPGGSRLAPDLAYGIRIPSPPPGFTSPDQRPVVGINPVPFSDPRAWVGSSTRSYDEYVEKLASFALWVIQRGYAVAFFPTQLRADPPVIEDIRSAMSRIATAEVTREGTIDYPIHSFDDLMSAMSRMDLVVATRFHGVVFSYLNGKPVIGIAYAGKTRDLMAQMGHAEYALEIFFELTTLQERFTELESRKADVREGIPERVEAHRRVLEEQYDRVFELLRSE